MLSRVIAQRLPKKDKKREAEEYALAAAAFKEFMDASRKGEGEREAFKKLVGLRAKRGMAHAFDGYGLSWDEAVELVRKKKGLTKAEKKKKKVLVAAIDNIIDFSAAEEYQLALAVTEEMEEEDIMELCELYNGRYANVEDYDIEYAMIVARHLGQYGDDQMMMYMTQGDDRVRPWHMAHEGFTAPLSIFPTWLIPPIEHQCRCYLVDVELGWYGQVKAAAGPQDMPEMPEWFNGTFKESVFRGGRIFSDEHPYFQIAREDLEGLNLITKELKKEWLGG